MVNFKLTDRQIEILTVLSRRAAGVTAQALPAFGFSEDEVRVLVKRNMVRAGRTRNGAVFTITAGGRDQLPLK